MKKTMYKNYEINGLIGQESNKVGSIMLWPTDTAPDGWLLCDGSAVSRTTYEKLFTLIGTTFGAGDGSTTFNVPDFTDKIPQGATDSTLARTVAITDSGTEIDALCLSFIIKYNDFADDITLNVIADNATSLVKTWSSRKIQNELNDKATIDDSGTYTNKVWSSMKVNNALASIGNVINDNATVPNQTWSSLKVSNELFDKASINDNTTTTNATWSSDKINRAIIGSAGGYSFLSVGGCSRQHSFSSITGKYYPLCTFPSQSSSTNSSSVRIFGVIGPFENSSTNPAKVSVDFTITNRGGLWIQFNQPFPNSSSYEAGILNDGQCLVAYRDSTTGNETVYLYVKQKYYDINLVSVATVNDSGTITLYHSDVAVDTPTGSSVTINARACGGNTLVGTINNRGSNVGIIQNGIEWMNHKFLAIAIKATYGSSTTNTSIVDTFLIPIRSSSIYETSDEMCIFNTSHYYVGTHVADWEFHIELSNNRLYVYYNNVTTSSSNITFNNAKVYYVD